MSASLCYDARVMHQRAAPHAYRFRYRLFSLMLDVDELDDLSRRLWLFSRNRFNLVSFHDRDFGPRDGSDLRVWAETHMRDAGLEPDGGALRILCFPRVLGYGFNPLSVWYCYRRSGELMAVILEVRNTFGQKHQYLLPLSTQEGTATLRHWEGDKAFYVSPFLPLDVRYRFALTAPAERLLVRVEAHQRDAVPGSAPMMLASWSGEARHLGDGRLLRLALRVPSLGLKIMALIHWQAIKLWWRGAPLHARPAPPTKEVTVTCPSSNHSR